MGYCVEPGRYNWEDRAFSNSCGASFIASMTTMELDNSTGSNLSNVVLVPTTWQTPSLDDKVECGRTGILSLRFCSRQRLQLSILPSLDLSFQRRGTTSLKATSVDLLGLR